MTSLAWILAGTLLMASLAWVGLAVLALRSESLHRILPALVAFAAGSLLGGSFLHLMPETLLRTGPVLEPFLWLLTGFVAFFLLEQFLHWRHDHGMRTFRHEAVTYLILLADGMHNFLGGLAIGGSFLVSPRVGFVTWLAAAAHEIPQELGDFAILLRGGWEARRALLFNFASALTSSPVACWPTSPADGWTSRSSSPSPPGTSSTSRLRTSSPRSSTGTASAGGCCTWFRSWRGS